MSRLRAKCFVGSVALHGLLLLLLVTGSGFLVSHPEPDWESMPVLDFIPSKLVDAAIVGGGDPAGAPPAPAAPQPRPQPAPAPVAPAIPEPLPPPPAKQIVKPQPEPEPAPRESKKPAPAKPNPPEPNSFSETGTKKAPEKPKIEVTKKLVTRDTAADRKKAAEQAEAQAAAEAAVQAARSAERARQVRSGQVGGAVSKLQSNLSGRSVVAVPYGPGGGGETYAGYGLYVRLIYDRAWRAPDEVPENSAVVTARVVIGRDGRVLSSEIVSKSGVAALDKSVAAALGRVTTIGRPFPEESKDDRKTFLIDFDLRAKRGIG